MSRLCKCGCKELVRSRRVFVNKGHQLEWMRAGGAKEMNALQPVEAKQAGGATAGRMAVETGRLIEAAAKGAARTREIADEMRRRSA